MAIILNFLSLDITAQINCQVLITSELIFGYLSLVAASLLIVFRIVAIWNNNKLVIGIAITAWVANVSVIILGKLTHLQLRSVWDDALRDCIVPNTEANKPNIIVTLITDFVLLLVMLIGLFRLLRGSGSFALGYLLWKQGVIWLLIATIAEVPPTVFIILNLNGIVDFILMFQLPSLITMSIAATRMYRTLADFLNESTHITFEDLQKSDTIPSRMNWNPSASIPLSPTEVTVDSSWERHPTARTIISVETHESSPDTDLEKAMENPVPGRNRSFEDPSL
ncbi:hypothetical protein BJV77DRAFT_1004422 [Russula vinacea]|nr:hypothetical protein BJV77DRAFT_1004422 [Russula vinacea]